MQKHIRRRSQQKELPRADPLAPSHVDLSAQGLEQVRHLLNLIQDHEAACLFIQIEIGFCQDLPICVAFKIEIHRRPRLGYCQREGGLANLPWPQKDDSRLIVEGGQHGLMGVACIHTCNYSTPWKNCKVNLADGAIQPCGGLLADVRAIGPFPPK